MSQKRNEFDPRCENEEIVLMGDNMDILDDQQFARYAFEGFQNGENIDQLRPVGYTTGDGRQVLTSWSKGEKCYWIRRLPQPFFPH